MSRHSDGATALTAVGQAFTHTVGINPVGLGGSARVANQSAYVLNWQWGDASGYVQPGSMDVLYPGAQAGDIRFTVGDLLVSSLPAGTPQSAYFEVAFEEKFPGSYPQVLIPFFVVAKLAP